MDNRKEIYDKLKDKYQNLEFDSRYEGLLKLASPFYTIFKKNPTNFIGNIPEDGVLLFISNHSNVYDSLVCNYVFRDYKYFVLAGNEPRNEFSGKSFLAHGVYWLDRSDYFDRKNACNFIYDTLKLGGNIALSPEGIWCLNPYKLSLRMGRGTFESCIKASSYQKIYIVPLIINYNYFYDCIFKKYRVKSVDTTICNSILVNDKMDSITLTNQIQDLFWTIKWYYVEKEAMESKKSILIPGSSNEYVFKREEQSIFEWERFTDSLRSQYKLDWEKEKTYEILSREEKLQIEMEKILNVNTHQGYTEPISPDKKLCKKM